ncbi:hypothetical protein FNF29_07068 [Cafeteria roenbergensis]|uniref:NADPH-dependent FMN reductase-like domain-containing protein n=1 Tax=Cafeteria roenbergensis TaxID=33653 RepID=A0A5A8C558_CAFRO|nr:hypothetical protein FNF29_07068 [Cafeteria roenbergensis]KAA0158578.1 hypothetical protein FNF31_05329 [Cafeteria roenbergensis]KAA0171086.1 hypothetical protein FNF28_01091 [Cafeteria roenbergensis]|eukprot:KAA0147854.1 hypothetical protein FNF29_07068 [Cafeteria roenbergensis]
MATAAPKAATGAGAKQARKGAPSWGNIELDAKWRWTLEELENAPWLVKGELTEASFLAIQTDAHHLMVDICKDVGISKKSMSDATMLCNSALILWQRYHASKKLQCAPKPGIPIGEHKFLAAAAVLVMSKALEMPIRVDPILHTLAEKSGALEELRNNPPPSSAGDPPNPERQRAERHAARAELLERFRERLLTAERKLLHVTAYDTVVELPSLKRQSKLVRFFGGPKSVLEKAQQAAQHMLTRTRLALILSAKQMADLAVFFAARMVELPLPIREEKELRPWFTQIRLTWPELRVGSLLMLRSMIATGALPNMAAVDKAMMTIESTTRERASVNAGVARAFAAAAAAHGMEVITVDNDLPMFNSDLWTVGEDGQPVAPAAVAAAKEAVRGADAVAIFSPEYNYGVPPVTSNVIAWLSNQGNVLAGKPAVLMGAGGRMGTSRMQYQLRTMAVFLDLHVMNKPEVCINAFAGPVFDKEGSLVGKDELELVERATASFAAFARATLAGKAAGAAAP